MGEIKVNDNEEMEDEKKEELVEIKQQESVEINSSSANPIPTIPVKQCAREYVKLRFYK